MAWIESHQALGNHPKLLKLSRAMGWSRADTLGRLHLFWHWCLDYATDGQLERHGLAIIADVFDVDDTDHEKFALAMRESEFIDFEPQFRVHDWWDYAGRFLQVRYKRTPKVWKEIKRLYGHSIQRTNNRAVTDKQPTNNRKPNQPNQPNLTNPTTANNIGARGLEVLRTDAERVWDAFPPNARKVGKGAVKKWFDRYKPDADIVRVMIEKLSFLAKSEQWLKDGGGFIPSPMTWLNQRRWEDEFTQSSKIPANRPPPPPPKTDPIARGQWKQVYGDPKAHGYE